jgi:hypothetical protein
LTIADGKRGLDMIHARSETIDGLTYWTTGPARRARSRDDLVHLLPIYDEYLVAYRDRIAVPLRTLFRNAVVVAGQVAGAWRPILRDGRTVVDITPIRPLSQRDRHVAARAAARCEQFANPRSRSESR